MLVSLLEAKKRWVKAGGTKRWPNFKTAEFACRCCGEIWWQPKEFDRAQSLRTALDRPVKFNSTHRCARHNAKIGGAPLSQHKKIAFDFSLRGVTDAEMLTLQDKMVEAGFGSFGLYRTFIHTDSRRGRFWVCKGGDKWKNYFKRR